MPTGGPDRRRARELAGESVRRGDNVGWFEQLYAEAEHGDAVIPWADMEPNPFLIEAVAPVPVPADGRALVVGCGYGDDAAHLAGLGWQVSAFDVSPTSVAAAARRWSSLGASVVWDVADVLAMPPSWQGAFSLVAEVYTVQVLPPGSAERSGVAAAIAATVAPGGALVVVARARDEGEPFGEVPWPLDHAELDRFAAGTGLVEVERRMALDHREDPPPRRWVARYRRP